MCVLRQALAEVRIHCGEWDLAQAVTLELPVYKEVSGLPSTDFSHHYRNDSNEHDTLFPREAW